MMAFVEDIAGRHRRIVEPAERRLGHDQRVVGDDDARARRLRTFFSTKQRRKCGQAEWTHSPRRSASAPTRARPISSAEPAGKIAADHIAGLARGDPARDQAERRRGAARPRRRGSGGFLVVQQAEKILAPLADHDAAALLVRVGIEPVELAGDLGLQVAGEGRDPHRALVLLGPQARRRDIAERLADAGAGLGEDRVRLVGDVARGRRRR